ncbi:hypothetical protein [Cellulophaga baltica]|uniref:hypothetical protein n=1 Tax=Cellulophaga baltica TaxID=76594 RepID=UPI00249565FF|nr:hypothetical protein [Cellulophaga baltica]
MQEENITIRQIKKGLIILLALGVVAEMVFFPSLTNLYGCIMAVISLTVFLYFFKTKYVQQYPFAFCMYLSMFLYRFLPLIATLSEGKPITYGFERPYETFIYEITLFLISSLSFYLACKLDVKKNNALQTALFKFKFFEITPAILWGMGIIGIVVRIYNFSAGEVEYGDVGGKFLDGLTYLMFAPICLFFPTFLNIKFSHKKALWTYTILIFLINIASNKRTLIITPFGIFAILSFLYLVINKKKISDIIPPVKLVLGGLILFVGLNFLSNLSLAMLYTRETMMYDQDTRNNANKLDAFTETIETVQNEQLMTRLKAIKSKVINKQTKYTQGWTEYYVDNFMLSRYANLRITDETLYYAEKKGYANRQMFELFKKNIIVLLPTPVLNYFGVFIDKSEFEFSRGDFLYGSGFGGYRVTSHVGDGLATFGYWYFLLQFIIFILIFKALSCFTYYSQVGIEYAPFALMNVFTFLGLFRNAQGISGDFGYLIRGYTQGIITYLIILHFLKMILKIVNPNLVRNNS